MIHTSNQLFSTTWLEAPSNDMQDSNAEGLKTCLNTLKIYIKNLHENPLDTSQQNFRESGFCGQFSYYHPLHAFLGHLL